MSITLAALVVFAAQGQALQPRPITLSRPERVLEVEFTQIRGLRELRDGRVIVSDRLEKGVVVANFGDNTTRAIGQTGRGPAEYRLPTTLVAMPGDSTLLFDEGNQRLAIIGPDLRIHRSFVLMVPGIAAPVSPRSIDSRGRYYFQKPWWMRGENREDSLEVFRYDPRTQRIDTLFRVNGLTLPPPGPALHVRMPYVAFAAQDAWEVSVDGRIAIARSRDYHIEWRDSAGRSLRGAPVTFERRLITTDERLDYARTFSANSGQSDRDGSGISAAPASALADAAVRALVEHSFFADFAPPFTDRIPFVSNDGALWLERMMRRGQPPTWDVFDANGRNVFRVQLPSGRRLAGVSAAWLYLVATDADGVERIERYRREAH